MKKRFLFFVSAVSCLLFGTWSARAVELSDGAVIKIGTEQLIHEDISNWNPTGKSAGSIRYDETTHTWTGRRSLRNSSSTRPTKAVLR